MIITSVRINNKRLRDFQMYHWIGVGHDNQRDDKQRKMDNNLKRRLNEWDKAHINQALCLVWSFQNEFQLVDLMCT